MMCVLMLSKRCHLGSVLRSCSASRVSAELFSSKELRSAAKLLAECHWACGLLIRQCSF